MTIAEFYRLKKAKKLKKEIFNMLSILNLI